MMNRDPVTVLPQPGVYALVNKERKYAYVAHTVNLQKRSHSMSHMLMQADKYPPLPPVAERGNRAKRRGAKTTYWAIADLPRHPSDEFTFMVLAMPVPKKDAGSAVLTAQRSLRAKGFKIIDGNRGNQTVVYNGTPMPLAEALRLSGSNVKYLTAWRRIERGWTLMQALGLEDPDPRWNTKARAERRKRAAQYEKQGIAA